MPTSEENKRIIKEAFKEASKEWLDDKFAHFGKWSMTSVAAACLVGLAYFLLTMNGWKHTP